MSTAPSSPRKVIIIGAGVGGTATAARLAHAGFQVDVYEKNDFAGGRCSLITHAGYRFDQGPSLLLLPPLFKQLYHDLGTTLEEHVDLIQCSPNYLIHYHDGETVTLSSDRAVMAAEAEKWDGPGGAERLEGFLALLQWTETCEGIWYPRGGFQQVPRSLQRIAESHGATFHFNSPISTVLRDASGKARGVRRESGEEEEADVVVVNADLVWAYNNLFTKDGEAGNSKGEDLVDKVQKKLLDPRAAKRMLGKPHSCSSISFYWAMDRQIPELRAHNIFLAEEYKSSFDDIFKHQSLPQQASFYVNVPSRVDPSAAPEGKDAIVVLVPVGHLVDEDGKKDKMNVSHDGRGRVTKSQDWEAMVEKARGQVIESMEKRLGIKGLRGMITWEEVNTPLTWKEKFNLTHGSILGITHDFFNVLFFRHQARHPRVKGAYFVGASAHPGTGVPIAIAGSKLCAQAVMDDHQVSYPASYAFTPSPATSGSLDVRHPRALLYKLEDWFSFLLPYLLGAFLALAIALAVRIASAGRLDLFEYIYPQTFVQSIPVQEIIRPKSTGEVILDKVQQVVGTQNVERLTAGAAVLVPLGAAGLGWARAQRVRTKRAQSGR